MKELYELKEKLLDELKEYGKKDMSAGSLDVVDKLTHTIKNLDRIIEKYDGGHSQDWHSNRRDSMGRYVSRDYGYSYAGEMASELRDLMEKAPDERTKQEFKRFISKIESM